jgi:integrase
MKIEKVFREDLQAYRWKINLTVDGKRIRRAEFLTKKEAQDAIAALLTNSRNKRYGMASSKPKVTLGDLKEKCDKNERFWIFEEFVSLIGEDTELTKLTKADWRNYLNALNARKLRPKTINRYMTQVCIVLRKACEYWPELEDWEPPKTTWLPEGSGRQRLLSKEELSKIFRALLADRGFKEREATITLRRDIYDLFRLMLLTGAREGEILNLKQSQISWDWKTVRIISRKGKKGSESIRVIPLSESALSILRSRLDHAPGFFPKIAPWRLQFCLERIGQLSNVAYGDKIENGWVCYDLRHIAATVMENHGIPYSAVSAILGHKRQDQTATYAHAQLDTLRNAVDVLESWCREIDGIMGVLGRNQTSADLQVMQA